MFLFSHDHQESRKAEIDRLSSLREDMRFVLLRRPASQFPVQRRRRSSFLSSNHSLRFLLKFDDVDREFDVLFTQDYLNRKESAVPLAVLTDMKSKHLSNVAFPQAFNKKGLVDFQAVGVSELSYFSSTGVEPVFWLLRRLLSPPLENPQVYLNSQIPLVQAGFHLNPSCGKAETQGRREEMEDFSVCRESKDDWLLCGVYDGHGGTQTSEGCGKYLHLAFADSMRKGSDPVCSLYKAVVDTEARLRSLAGSEVTRPNGRDGWLGDASGSTLNVVVVDRKRGMLFCANVGDARAVLCRDTKAIPLSFDQKPDDPIEASRVLLKGGFVAMGRVDGQLAVSRAIGDFEFKKPGYEVVDFFPDITTTSVNPRKDGFVILACDGLWDVVSSQEACDFLLKYNANENKKPEALARALVQHALDLGSMDNISVIVIKLNCGIQPKTPLSIDLPPLSPSVARAVSQSRTPTKTPPVAPTRVRRSSSGQIVPPLSPTVQKAVSASRLARKTSSGSQDFALDG